MKQWIFDDKDEKATIIKNINDNADDHQIHQYYGRRDNTDEIIRYTNIPERTQIEKETKQNKPTLTNTIHTNNNNKKTKTKYENSPSESPVDSAGIWLEFVMPFSRLI